MTLTPMRTVTEVTEIAHTIKSRIQVIPKESKCTDHAIIEIHMTRTANEDSPSIYTLGDGGRIKEKKKRNRRQRKKVKK